MAKPNEKEPTLSKVTAQGLLNSGPYGTGTKSLYARSPSRLRRILVNNMDYIRTFGWFTSGMAEY